MIFSFLKYVNPISYFNKMRKNNRSIFPIWEEIPNEVKEFITLDSSYSSKESSYLDASWQLVQKGYIGNTETYKFNFKNPLQDEYRFVRKYYNRIWVYYILLIRIVTFNNPILEIIAFVKAFNTKKINVYDKPLIVPEWNSFKSQLIDEQPKISVIIPTLNRYKYLKDVLKDLEKQDYKNFDVIVVDQSVPFQKEFYNDFDLEIQLIHQEEKALWLARNTAIEASKNKYIALSEDDVRIEKDWISLHLKCLDFFKADISAGVFFPQNKEIPKHRSFFKYAFQFATGNAILSKEVFQKIGLFDRQFEKQRMGDGEFGLRAYLAGFKSISNPYAYCLDVKAATGGLREMGSWDAMRPKKWFSPRPIPSVLYLYRKYWGNKMAIFALLQSVPLSLTPYHMKGTNKGYLQSLFILIVFFPFILLQVIISWSRANTKLKQGNLIKKL